MNKVVWNRTVINGKDYFPANKNNENKPSDLLFAEFKCLKCTNEWKATIKTSDEVRKCFQCKQMVKPTKVRNAKKGKLGPKKSNENLIGSGPFFADFKCNGCQKEWKSAYSWLTDDCRRKMHQKCKCCNRNVFPENMRKLERGLTEATKPHVQHLCQKCKQLEHSCEREKKEKY